MIHKKKVFSTELKAKQSKAKSSRRKRRTNKKNIYIEKRWNSFSAEAISWVWPIHKARLSHLYLRFSLVLFFRFIRVISGFVSVAHSFACSLSIIIYARTVVSGMVSLQTCVFAVVGSLYVVGFSWVSGRKRALAWFDSIQYIFRYMNNRPTKPEGPLNSFFIAICIVWNLSSKTFIEK